MACSRERTRLNRDVHNHVKWTACLHSESGRGRQLVKRSAPILSPFPCGVCCCWGTKSDAGVFLLWPLVSRPYLVMFSASWSWSCLASPKVLEIGENLKVLMSEERMAVLTQEIDEWAAKKAEEDSTEVRTYGYFHVCVRHMYVSHVHHCTRTCSRAQNALRAQRRRNKKNIYTEYIYICVFFN